MAGSSGEAKFASEHVVSINELLQNRSQLNAGTIEGHQPSYKVDLAFQVVPKEEAQADERENGDENDDNAADGGGHDDDEPEEVESDEDSPFDRHGNLRGGTSLSALSAQHLETPFQKLWLTLTDLVDPDLLPVMHGRAKPKQKSSAASPVVPQAATNEDNANQAEALANVDDRRRRKILMVEMLERHVATHDQKMHLNELLEWTVRADFLARVKAVFPLLRVSGPPPSLSTEQWQLIVLVIMNSIAADLPAEAAAVVKQRIAEYFSGEKIHSSEESKTQLSRFATARASAKKSRFPGVTMEEFRLLSTVFEGDDEQS